MRAGDWVMYKGEKRQIIVEWDEYSVYLFGDYEPMLVSKSALSHVH